MIPTLQRYGLLGSGEERMVPVVKENPADVLASTFAVWRGVLPERISAADVEPLYQEAVKLVSPYAREFSGMGAKEFEEVRRQATLSPSRISGLFLSAVLNCTGLEAMARVFNMVSHLGYRLGEGKLLVILPGSYTRFTGLYSRGIIVNGSDLYKLADKTLGGTQINYGRLNFFCMVLENTMSINSRTNYSIEHISRSGLELIMNPDGKSDIAFHYSELFGKASLKETEPFSSLSRQALGIARQLSWLPASDGVDLSVHPPAYWRSIDVRLRGILKEMNDAVAGYRGK